MAHSTTILNQITSLFSRHDFEQLAEVDPILRPPGVVL